MNGHGSRSTLRKPAAACAAAFTIALMGLPAAAVAAPQASQGRWEVEVFAGAATVTSSDSGTGALPPPGEAFTVASLQSRRVSSWYFGDGAAFLNQVNAGLGSRGRQVTPLDPLLTAASVERESGPMLGGRLRVAVAPRVGLEFAVQYADGGLVVRDDRRAPIESARTSVVDALAAVVTLVPLTSRAIASSTEINVGTGRRVAATGAVSYNLTRGRVVPYVTAGGGVVSHTEDEPASVRVTVNYEFVTVQSGLSINEADEVTVTYTTEGIAPVALFGGGLSYAITRRSGVRFDARMHLSPNRSRTFVDARPVRARSAPPGLLVISTGPAIAFSNLESSPLSTLSGPPIERFETFRGSGLDRQFAVTAGWFWRF